MRCIATLSTLAILLLVCIPVLTVANDDKESMREKMIAAADDTAKLATLVQKYHEAGTLEVGDFQRMIYKLRTKEDYARINVLAAAGFAYVEGNPGQTEHRDLYHATFLHWQGIALLEIGHPQKALNVLEKISQYCTVNELGLASYWHEYHLGLAYNRVGRYEDALKTMTIPYVLTGFAVLHDAFVEAYKGSGRDMAKLDEFVQQKREEIAVYMDDLGLQDYEGNHAPLDEYKGKVTVLMSWFRNCAGCNTEMPFLQKLYEKYKDEGLSVVAVEMFGEGEKALKYREKHYGFAKFPFLNNVKGREGIMVTRYGANGNGTFILNSEGKIVYSQGGWNTHLEPILERRVREELGLPPQAEQNQNSQRE